MFAKMKLKPYLLMVFSVVIVLAAVITIVGSVGLIQTNKNATYLVDHVLTASDAVKTCQIEVNRAARNLREMVLTTDAQDIADMEASIQESIAEIETQIQVFKTAHGTKDNLAQTYEDAFSVWFSIADRAIAQIDNGNTEAAKKIILEECSPALTNLVNIDENIDTTIQAERTEQENKTVFTLDIFIAVNLILFAIALVFSLLVAFRAVKGITVAVSKMKDAVQGLSEGDLSAQVDYDAQNEFGELAERMNFSFHELSRYVDAINFGMSEFSKGNFSCECPIQFLGDFVNIQHSIESFQAKISSTLYELGASSAQVSAGANQVADGAQALAQGATEQASSIEELSASISDVTTRITDTAEFSRKADDLGKDARETVNRGKEEMKELLSSIQDIAEASNNIQSIIKVIDDIAFQTNILALNAAVEAARAGNAGKGFAVVADEVRSLAQKSADAARETTGLIKNSLQHVSQGKEIALRTDAAFNEVADAAQDILGMIEKIATASNAQAASISEISLGIDQISSVVQTNSATSEESAAASEELSSQASIMKNLLDQFTLPSVEYIERTSATSVNSTIRNYAASNTASCPADCDADSAVAPVSDKY